MKTFKIILTAIIASAFACGDEDINHPVDISAGLAAYWSFDNDDGAVINDDSGNSLRGTAYNTEHVVGRSGNCISFNGTDSKLIFPETGAPPPVSVAGLKTGSISLWFKYLNMGSQILPLLYFGESNTGTAHNSLIIEIGHGGGTNPSNKRLYFTIVNQGFCFDTGVNLPENTWHHFTAVVSETGNTGYLNGAEMTARKYNLGSDSNYTDFFEDVPVKELLSLGYGRYGQEDPFFFFKGCIDEVRIYNRALNREEIRALYELKN